MIHESQGTGFDWWRISISLCQTGTLVDLGSVLNKNVVTKAPVGRLNEFRLFGFVKVAK